MYLCSNVISVHHVTCTQGKTVPTWPSITVVSTVEKTILQQMAPLAQHLSSRVFGMPSFLKIDPINQFLRVSKYVYYLYIFKYIYIYSNTYIYMMIYIYIIYSYLCVYIYIRGASQCRAIYVSSSSSGEKPTFQQHKNLSSRAKGVAGLLLAASQVMFPAGCSREGASKGRLFRFSQNKIWGGKD